MHDSHSNLFFYLFPRHSTVIFVIPTCHSRPQNLIHMHDHVDWSQVYLLLKQPVIHFPVKRIRKVLVAIRITTSVWVLTCSASDVNIVKHHLARHLLFHHSCAESPTGLERNLMKHFRHHQTSAGTFLPRCLLKNESDSHMMAHFIWLAQHCSCKTVWRKDTVLVEANSVPLW